MTLNEYLSISMVVILLLAIIGFIVITLWGEFKEAKKWSDDMQLHDLPSYKYKEGKVNAC